MSCVALLRPLPALMMSSMTFGSIPALTPITSASEEIDQRGRGEQIVAELCDLSEAGLLADEEHLAKVLEQRLGDLERRARARGHYRERPVLRPGHPA